MEKKNQTKIIIAIFLIVAITLGLYFTKRSYNQSYRSLAGWGQGKMKLSEQIYHRKRLWNIIKNWKQTAEVSLPGIDVEYDREGRLKESYRIFLVIDLNKQAVWIEENGKVQEKNYAEFPANMHWTLYYSIPQGETKLPGRTILKIRGLEQNKKTPEQFYLVGTGRGIGYLSFHFGCSTNGSDCGLTNFTSQLRNYRHFPSAISNKTYGSLIVTNAEYRRYCDSLSDLTSKQPNYQTTRTPIPVAFENNIINWTKAEKLLYMEIDGQVRTAGYELKNLTVKAGPDFSAAHAEVRAEYDSLFRRIFGLGRFISVETYLKIDSLGNNLWYAKSAPHPKKQIPPRQQLNLEFLVFPAAAITRTQYREYIRKGRWLKRPELIPESKWNATLPNGAIIEFIGICDNPSAGKKWWGPDGSILDCVPYTNIESSFNSDTRENKHIYEIAWRINWPTGIDGIKTHFEFEGCHGYSHKQFRDKYGHRIDPIKAGAFVFPNTSTSLKIGTRAGNGNDQTVTFKNITLIPGENQGFEIKLNRSTPNSLP